MKTFKIRKIYKGREIIVEGTLKELISYFRCTLETGNLWNHKISRNPKNIDSLVKNLQSSYEEKEALGYSTIYVEIAE